MIFHSSKKTLEVIEYFMDTIHVDVNAGNQHLRDID